MSFKGKVVIVTGASSGIGAAIAVAFAKEGADVAMVGRNESKLASVRERCAAAGKPPLVIAADVSNDEDAARIVQETVRQYGKLDVLVNNAGIAYMGCILDGRLMEAFDQINATNLRAPMLLTTLAAPHLMKTKGNIINISSVAGELTPKLPTVTPYSILKSALNHFTRSAAMELSSHGIRVNAVSPGPIITDILKNSGISESSFEDFKNATALNKLGETEEIADLVLFLASDKAKSVTGSNYVCDNGMMLKH